MRKKIIREREGTLIAIDIVFYIAVIIVGYLLVDYENYNIVATFKFLPSIFYIIGALSFIAYFLNRKRDYYEFLMFSLINVITGTYILANSINYVGNLLPWNTYIVGDALLFYSIASICNKLYIVKKYWDNKNINFIPRLVNSVLITFISAFAVYSLYTKADLAFMIIGYYIMGFGLISLLEPLTYIVLNNPTVDKLLVSFLKYNKGEEVQSKPPKSVKSIARKKISFKERQGSLLKKEENIKKNSKKK